MTAHAQWLADARAADPMLPDDVPGCCAVCGLPAKRELCPRHLARARTMLDAQALLTIERLSREVSRAK